MRIRLCHAWNGVDSAQDQLAESILVRDFNDDDDIRLSPAGINGFDLLDLGEGACDRAGLSRLHIDEHVSSICHNKPAIDRRVNSTGYG